MIPMQKEQSLKDNEIIMNSPLAPKSVLRIVCAVEQSNCTLFPAKSEDHNPVTSTSCLYSLPRCLLSCRQIKLLSVISNVFENKQSI